MTTQPLAILIVEDNAGDAELLVRELRKAGFEPHWLRVETEPDRNRPRLGSWRAVVVRLLFRPYVE